jgi:hypothetical protein
METIFFDLTLYLKKIQRKIMIGEQIHDVLNPSILRKITW